MGDKKTGSQMTMKQLHRKINVTFTCQNCKKTVTEKTSYARRNQRRFCKKCNPVKVWFKRHPNYGKTYRISYRARRNPVVFY